MDAPLAAAAGGRLYPVFSRSQSPPCRCAPGPEATTAGAAGAASARGLVTSSAAAGWRGSAGKDVLKLVVSWHASGGLIPGSLPEERLHGIGPPVEPAALRPEPHRRQGEFVFLDANPNPSDSKHKGRSGGTEGAGGVGGHAHAWSYYAKKGGGNDGRRRSYLPYRQDLVGLFASTTAFRRSYHPF